MKRLVIKPKVAEDVIEIDADKLLPVTDDNVKSYIFPRIYGDFAGKSFYLQTEYNWFIGRDSSGMDILIVTKK